MLCVRQEADEMCSDSPAPTLLDSKCQLRWHMYKMTRDGERSLGCFMGLRVDMCLSTVCGFDRCAQMHNCMNNMLEYPAGSRKFYCASVLFLYTISAFRV